MAFLITNTSDKRFGKQIPLTITFKDGLGETVKKELKENSTIAMYFKPVSVMQMEVANVVSCVYIPDADVLKYK